MSDENTPDLSRRKLLTRVGALAAVAYTVPAFTTMSMAHASSGSSAASSRSSASSQSSVSSVSSPSEPSDPSDASDASAASVASNAGDCAESGGTWDDATRTCTAG